MVKAPKSAITGDLGMSIANTAFLRAGFAFRAQPQLDFGVDALAELVVDEQATGQLLAIQVKSGRSYFRESDGDNIIFRPPNPDQVPYWLDFSVPVIVCLVDADAGIVYWQAINESTVESTGSGYKISVPRSQIVREGDNPSLEAIVTPVIPARSYTVVEQADISTGLAKRYRVRVVLTGEMSKAEVVAVIRQVTSEVARRSYNRSDIAAQRWGDSEADCVWTFVYPSIADVTYSNWVARSEWIAEGLSEEAQPLETGGEELGDGLRVLWNPGYEEFAQLQADGELTKGEYLALVDGLLPGLREALSVLSQSVSAVREGRVAEADFVDAVQGELRLIEEAEEVVANRGAVPYECSDVDLKLLGFINHVHNVTLYFTRQLFLDRDEANRLGLAAESLKQAQSDLDDLDYELRKVR